ncbi:MAG: response regulator, partial [Deltaproteobacteria bacterium]|nr:response regulator [Deltaproteobacteria bacterium]
MENEAAIEGAGRIVIVEDDRVTARDLQESLETCGYAVIGVVSDGKEAIDLATAKQPDLVLMDILLEGDLDGIEVAGELRHRLDVPIVYLTAYSREELIERAKLTEPFAFLLKPFRKEHLRATIEMALRQHRLTKRTRENFERELAEKSVELARAVENLETEIQWRKSIQVALLKEQARYLSLVESAPLGIVTYSHEGDITGANPAFWNLIGIKAASRATVFNLRDTPTV